MNKKNYSTLVVLLILQSIMTNVSGQSDYQSAGVIYKDSYVTVELQYRFNDPCTGGGAGKSSRYRLFVTGSPYGYDMYLNWRMDYFNCDQSITCQTCNYNIGTFPNEGPIENIDWKFDGYKIEVPFYDVSVTQKPEKRASYTKALPKSAPPKSISGNTNLDYGDQTTLSVKGGVLGTKAQWKWYGDICGNSFLGTGEPIKLSPIIDREYFVRAESPTDTTSCVSVKVRVNLQSRTPDHIEGKKIICVGEKNISLSVSGGRLGKDAEWVWYQDSSLATSIGRGRNILVSPEKGSTFYVRAESNINITDAKNIRVSIVDEKLKDPDKIIGNTFVCKGNSLEFKVSGGLLPETATWCWYKNDIQSKNLIGKGSTVNIRPEETSVYYVRGEGVCSNTKERTISVEVGSLSVNPYDISSINDPQNKRKTILSVLGGSLGNNSNWKWYKGNCNGAKMGTGKSISVKVNKETTFFVKAEGECNSTTCISQRVYPRKVEKYTFINFGVVPGIASGDDLPASFKRIRENPVVSLTIGKLAKTGWYIRGKYSTKSKPTLYSIQDNSITNFNSQTNYYIFNGKSTDNRWGITLGIIKKLSNSFFFLAGAGYGQRDLIWGVSEYSNQNNSLIKESWGKHLKASYTGLEAEAGIVIRVSVFNISLGVNAIAPPDKTNIQNSTTSYKVYIDGYAGIGFSF